MGYGARRERQSGAKGVQGKRKERCGDGDGEGEPDKCDKVMI